MSGAVGSSEPPLSRRYRSIDHGVVEGAARASAISPNPVAVNRNSILIGLPLTEFLLSIDYDYDCDNERLPSAVKINSP